MEYEDAAKRHPDNRSIQERLERARRHVASDMAEAAVGAAQARRLPRAKQLIEDAIAIDSNSQKVIEARRMVAGAWAAEAASLLDEDGDVNRALAAAETARSIDADGPNVRTTRNRVRSAYLDSMREQADSFEIAGHKASALLALVRVSEEAGRTDMADRERMNNLRSEFRNQAAFTVEIGRFNAPRRLRGAMGEIEQRLLGLEPPSECPNLRVVRQARSGPGASLSGALDEYEIDTTERTRREPHEYQSGTRTVPNPEWPGKKKAVEDKQQDLDATLEDIQRLMQEVSERQTIVVEAGPSDNVEILRSNLEDSRERLTAAREDAQAISQELADLHEVLNQTPETLEEPVMTREDVVITEVNRSFRVETHLNARNLDTNEVFWERRLFVGESSTEGEHHDGLPQADVAPVPLELPLTDQELRDEGVSKLLSEIRDDIADLCRAHQEVLRQEGLSRAAADDTVSATHWFVLALFMNPTGDMDDWDRDGRVRRFFRETWGLEDPSKLAESAN